jgi:hypothetical protein
MAKLQTGEIETYLEGVSHYTTHRAVAPKVYAHIIGTDGLRRASLELCAPYPSDAVREARAIMVRTGMAVVRLYSWRRLPPDDQHFEVQFLVDPRRSVPPR